MDSIRNSQVEFFKNPLHENIYHYQKWWNLTNSVQRLTVLSFFFLPNGLKKCTSSTKNNFTFLLFKIGPKK